MSDSYVDEHGDLITNVTVSDTHLSGLMFNHDGRGFNVELDLEAGRTLTRVAEQLGVSNEGIVKVVIAVIEAERRAS